MKSSLILKCAQKVRQNFLKGIPNLQANPLHAACAAQGEQLSNVDDLIVGCQEAECGMTVLVNDGKLTSLGCS